MLLFLLWGGKSNSPQSPLQGGIFNTQATVLLLTATAIIAKNKFHHLPSPSPILDVSYSWAALWLIRYVCMVGGLLWSECVPPKFLCWSLMANERVFGGRTFRLWLGHEDLVFVSGIVPSGSRECLWSFYHVRSQWKDIICKSGGRTSLETKSASAFVLELPSF